MKARGLTRLRWYCQVCQKACRDANGYKMHISSEAHARQLAAATGEGGQRAGKVVHDYSSQFQREFVILLSRRFGTRRVLANQVYQEYIQDRHHVHMNATRWVSLSEFVKYLGRAGIARVEESELGWFVSWIDNSPSARARQDAAQKMDRQKVDDEQRSRKLLEEQIKRAKKDDTEDVIAERKDEGIKRTDEAPVKIALVNKPRDEQASEGAAPAAPAAPSPAPSSSTPAHTKPPGPAPGVFSMRLNPLKAASQAARPNPLADKSGPPKKRPPPTHLGAAERIIMEEQSRKQGFKRKDESSRPAGPVPEPGAKRSRF